MLRISAIILLLVTVLLGSGVASARPDILIESVPTRQRRPASATSQSVGRANRGRLENGVLLLETPTLQYRSGGPEQRWGTEELVGMLHRASEHVAGVLPGARLVVGDLSRRRGGRFHPHRSHRSGRDVDIGFYMLDDEGQSAYRNRFLRFSAVGKNQAESLAFDVARNWELVRSLVTDARASIQYIFVARSLRASMLAHAEQSGAPADVITRAAAVMEQPRRGGRHNDHFHVRVYCAVEDRPRCSDAPPYHEWYPRDPEAAVATAPSTPR